MQWLKRLTEYLLAGITPSEATITGIRTPLGYQQIVHATLASAQHLTIPTLPAGFNVGYAVIQCSGGVVRWRDDGTAPTTTVGMQIADGAELNYAGDFTAIQLIEASGSAQLNISYYAP